MNRTPLLILIFSLAHFPTAFAYDFSKDKQLMFSEPQDVVTRIDGRIAQWAANGYDEVDDGGVVDLLDFRAKKCAQVENCQKWDGLSYVCSPRALQNKQISTTVFNGLAASITDVKHLPVLKNVTAKVNSSCLQRIVARVIWRTKADSKLHTAAVDRFSQLVLSPDATPRAIIDLFDGEPRAEVRNKISLQIIQNFYSKNRDSVDSKELVELSYFTLLQLRRPAALVQFYEKNPVRFSAGIADDARASTNIFCISALFTGQGQKCLDALSKLTATPWVSDQKLRALIFVAKIKEAKAELMAVAPEFQTQCEKVPDEKLWSAFYAAQIFRVEGKIQQSTDCFLKAASKVSDKSVEQVINLEVIKAKKFTEIRDYGQILNLRSHLASDNFGDSLFHIFVDIEMLKSFALAGRTSEFQALKEKILATLELSDLKVYRDLVSQIETELLQGKKSVAAPTNLEALDVSLLGPRIEAWRSNAKK